MSRDPIISGHESNIFVCKPSDKCDCPLCLNVLKDPQQCSNGHCFCKGCICTALAKQSECPLCKTHLTVKKLGKNLFMQNTIDEMDTYCISCDHLDIKNDLMIDRCQWIGQLHSRTAHYENDCGYYLEKCLNDGCDTNVQRRLMPIHGEQCEFRKIVCEFCGDSSQPSYSVSELKEHHKVCVQRPMPCPNQCSAVLSLRMMEHHLVTDCPLEMVTCPLAALGVCTSCPGSLTRAELIIHITNPATFKCVRLLKQQVLDLTAANIKLNHTVEALTVEVMALRTAQSDVVKAQNISDVNITMSTVSIVAASSSAAEPILDAVENGSDEDDNAPQSSTSTFTAVTKLNYFFIR